MVKKVLNRTAVDIWKVTVFCTIITLVTADLEPLTADDWRPQTKCQFCDEETTFADV